MTTTITLPFICLAMASAMVTNNSIMAQEWVALTDVPEPLTYPVVTVLDGKIHVIGGGGSAGATDAHYRYDPGTDSWDTLAPVPYLAQQPAGAAVNGKIHYFGGGYPNSGSPLDEHFVYDPSSDTWDSAAFLPTPRAIHYAVNLNETLYSLAGQSNKLLCQVYDAGSDTWITKNNLPDQNFWYGAHISANGSIYRFGGGGYISPVDDAHEYDPVMDTWTALPSMPEAVHGIDGTALDGVIYLVGGYYSGSNTDEVWSYDISSQVYDIITPLPVARSYHNVVTVGECIYSVGGNNPVTSVDVSLLRLCPYDTVDTVAGIKSRPQAGSFTAYCTSGVLNVNATAFRGQPSFLQVFDMWGRSMVSEAVLSSGLHALDVSHLSPALYVVKVETGGQVYTTKVYLPGL